MRRRDFIALIAVAIACPPRSLRAQQGKVWRLGYLVSGAEGPFHQIFRQRMAQLGYVEGENLIIDFRVAEGRYERLPDLAKELVALHPDVIVAEATTAIAAAQQATSTIPIVMSPATDPVGSGFVKSFSRPGGNITGVANMYGDLTAKSLEVLHTIVPDAKTVAVLMSSNPTHPKLYDESKGCRSVDCSFHRGDARES